MISYTNLFGCACRGFSKSDKNHVCMEVRWTDYNYFRRSTNHLFFTSSCHFSHRTTSLQCILTTTERRRGKKNKYCHRISIDLQVPSTFLNDLQKRLCSSTNFRLEKWFCLLLLSIGQFLVCCDLFLSFTWKLWKMLNNALKLDIFHLIHLFGYLHSKLRNVPVFSQSCFVMATTKKMVLSNIRRCYFDMFSCCVE